MASGISCVSSMAVGVLRVFVIVNCMVAVAIAKHSFGGYSLNGVVRHCPVSSFPES